MKAEFRVRNAECGIYSKFGIRNSELGKSPRKRAVHSLAQGDPSYVAPGEVGNPGALGRAIYKIMGSRQPAI
jgi:hypothetical protein